MKIFIVYWHPEPQSFNGSMFRTACKVLVDVGHEVRTSDLHEMRFDPVSSRKNFTTVKDQDYFKQQIEEMHATETKGFSAGLEAEMEKLVKDITDSLVRVLGKKPEHTHIVIQEINEEDWGFSGLLTDEWEKQK